MAHKIVIMATACMMAATIPMNAKTLKLKADNIDEIVKAMTIEEKVDLMIGTGMDMGDGETPSPVIGATRNIVPGAAGTTLPNSRLGIPAIVLSDGPAGLRIDPTREGDSNTYYCTHFPIGTLLASTWNTELVEQVGRAMGSEVLEYGADVLLAPALNIHRHPLCGRNFEYFSEDPLISGKIAAAYVRGVQSNNVGTSIKHFACNNQETNRVADNAIVSPRALREIYLKGFEIAVKESQPWTVMTSYNRLNGTYTSESSELLTDLLRDEWGFKGMVMTDWFGGSDAAQQVRAGNDMLQPGYAKQKTQILAAVADGSLSMADVDRNVKRVLELIVRTPHFKGYKYSNKPDLKGNAEVTRNSASEGMVLLKNSDNTLPLSADIKKVALFGNTSYRFIAGGTGSGNVNRAYTVSLLDGLENGGFQLNETLGKVYDEYLTDYDNNRPPLEGYEVFLGSNKRAEEYAISDELVKEMAEVDDVALITFGRISGEFSDRSAADFNLSKNEAALVEKVTKAFHAQGKRVVVVLNIGGVIETASWKSAPDAILCAWQAGQEGGNSVVDVLTGKANPSGKLPMTFPVKYSDAWSTLNFPIDQNENDNSLENHSVRNDRKDIDYTEYDEGIYVGYRYFDTKGKAVSYPFGYGLSYTEFSYANPEVSNDDDTITVNVDVTNVGKCSGKEVVELYVAAPTDHLDKPAKELKAFCKTKNLQPGETQHISFTLNLQDLASYNEDISAWVTDNGNYTFMLGSSLSDIREKVDVVIEEQQVYPTKVLFATKK
jgi:beta-glucosidase